MIHAESTRKGQILETAAQLFRIKGYSATSMRDIAREMGMEAASLYNHITSKQAILSELLLMIAEAFTAGMNQILKNENQAIKQLEALVALHVELTAKHTNAISLIPNEWVHLEGESVKEFLMLRENYEHAFKSVIARCMEEGSLKPGSVDLAAFSILSTLRWLYSWYNKNPQTDITKLKKQLIQNLIYGLQN